MKKGVCPREGPIESCSVTNMLSHIIEFLSQVIAWRKYKGKKDTLPVLSFLTNHVTQCMSTCTYPLLLNKEDYNIYEQIKTYKSFLDMFLSQFVHWLPLLHMCVPLFPWIQTVDSTPLPVHTPTLRKKGCPGSTGFPSKVFNLVISMVCSKKQRERMDFFCFLYLA